MYDVLVFVYENYWRGDACPEPEQLGRKLSANGFEDDEIRDALQWLDGLSMATQGIALTRSADNDQSFIVGERRTAEVALAQSSGARIHREE